VLVVCDFGGGIKLLDQKSGKPIANLTPHSGQVNAIAISRDGGMIAAGSFDGAITLWDNTGNDKGNLIVKDQEILSLAISPDSQYIVAGCRGTAFLFDLSKREEPKQLEAYRGNPKSFFRGIEGVAFAPDSRLFATGGMIVRIWETGSGKLVSDLPVDSHRINDLAFSPDGQVLAGVDRAGHLRLWDVAGRGLLTSTPAHSAASFGLAFSPDGQRIATTGRKDFAVKMWEVPTLRLIKAFKRAHP
jgi:WD40 repeat protein